MTEIPQKIGVVEGRKLQHLWGGHSHCLPEEGFSGVFEEHPGRCGRRTGRVRHVGCRWGFLALALPLSEGAGRACCIWDKA